MPDIGWPSRVTTSAAFPHTKWPAEVPIPITTGQRVVAPLATVSRLCMSAMAYESGARELIANAIGRMLLERTGGEVLDGAAPVARPADQPATAHIVMVITRHRSRTQRIDPNWSNPDTASGCSA